MRLAFVYPAMLVGGRPLDFDAIDTSPRGTTGSETMILSMAREMAARGHDVTLYIAQPQPERLWGARRSADGSHHEAVVRVKELPRAVPGQEFDAVCCSLDCNFFSTGLEASGKTPLRICFQQVNDFNYAARPDFASFVDLFVSPSRAHQKHMEEVAPTTKGKWEVLPNGCRLGDFAALQDPHSPPERVPGRMIYASSPDRGLHLLLQEWPAIKRAVPHAHLKIFYFALQRWIGEWSQPQEDPNWWPIQKELYRRANYVDRAIKALANYGVEAIGSVSRRQMAAEMMAAEVLAFPCDTVAYTEGFSCATLEGCASGALPVISGTDALGDIYRGAVPMVAAPARLHSVRWRELVIRALTDKPWADEWRVRARRLAEKHDWSDLAERFEKMLEARLAPPAISIESRSAPRAPATSNEKPPLDFVLTAKGTSGIVIDPTAPEDSACGGSRAGCLNLAKAMAVRGHAVRVRSAFTQSLRGRDGVDYRRLELPWDAAGRVVFAYFDTEPLNVASGALLKIASHHSYDPPARNWSAADVHTAPSGHCLQALRREHPNGRWALLQNAVADEGIVRDPIAGRVIYHASPDRGLFHLLTLWLQVLQAVPNATLHVVGDAWGVATTWGPRNLRPAIEGVRNLPSVRFLGPLPRAQLRRELAQASVFAYPCIPSGPTESFSICTMECCKIGLPVVLAPADALEEVYRGQVVLSTPDRFAADLVNVLRANPAQLEAIGAQEKTFAARFTYEAMAQRLETILAEALRA